MRPEVQEAVVAALRRSQLGFSYVTGSWSEFTGLSRWQRFVNWVAKLLGGDQPPFIDPKNFRRVEDRPLSHYADPALIDEALRELAPIPKCRICGAGPEHLAPDPAGYYCHAKRYDGAPLLCTRHPESKG